MNKDKEERVSRKKNPTPCTLLNLSLTNNGIGAY